MGANAATTNIDAVTEDAVVARRDVVGVRTSGGGIAEVIGTDVAVIAI
jgi:hypothetical protein